MSVKREHLLNYKRDLILGIVEDPFQKRLDLEEENNKVTITLFHDAIGFQILLNIFQILTNSERYADIENTLLGNEVGISLYKTIITSQSFLVG